eukprot:Nk52_evm1s1624 gene=Nk52_evmTU1s1624
MVSAKSIHEQPLNAIASEGGLGGLKNSTKDPLEDAIGLQFMNRDKNPLCLFSFFDLKGKACIIPTTSKDFPFSVTCIVKGIYQDCPIVKNEHVQVSFTKSKQKYELEMAKVNIEGFKENFKSKVEYKKSKNGRYKPDVLRKFHGYSIATYGEVGLN